MSRGFLGNPIASVHNAASASHSPALRGCRWRGMGERGVPDWGANRQGNDAGCLVTGSLFFWPDLFLAAAEGSGRGPRL